MKNSYKTRPNAVFTALILIAGLIWIWFSRLPQHSASETQAAAPQAGFPYPPFELATISGETITAADLAGRPLVVNFWASWCPPCRAEMPDFQTAADEYAGSDLMIAAINATNQDSLANVRAFIDSNQLTFPILLDESGQTARDYLVHSLPSTFFINRDGIITRVIIGGPIPLPLIRVEIDNILQDQ